MSEERQDVVIADEASAPRWVGIVVVALAVVSLVALGAGWTASTRSKQLEQSFARTGATVQAELRRDQPAPRESGRYQWRSSRAN